VSEVTIYGGSDDLIEIDGDLREEFTAYNEDEGVYVAFSDGTVLKVRYDEEGCWRITPTAKGRASYIKIEAMGADTPNYSDKVWLTLPEGETDEEFRWCLMGKDLIRATEKAASDQA
jgi:hypothetical protein